MEIIMEKQQVAIAIANIFLHLHFIFYVSLQT